MIAKISRPHIIRPMLNTDGGIPLKAEAERPVIRLMVQSVVMHA